MFLCKSIFLTKYAKECKKEEDIEIDDDDKSQSTNIDDSNGHANGHVNGHVNGQVQDQGLIAKNEHASETERNMQRMSYDFHNDQINDYVNNFNETGAYTSPNLQK